MAKKKAEDMRQELRNIISVTRGPSAWQELLQTERDIRVRRQKMIYAQEEARAKFFELLAISGAVLVISVICIGGIWLIGTERGLW